MSVFTLLCAGIALATVPAPTQEPDKSAWKDYQPDISTAAVKAVTDRYPLSDQKNEGKWKRYEPMTDEFKGKSLDPKKWLPTNPGWKGRQPAFFSPNNVTVADGKLSLTMRKEEPTEVLQKDGYHTWSSAAVQSVAPVLYGYFEVKAKPMRSHGSSAFWFYKGDKDRWTEIDVFEIGGGAPDFKRKQHITVHVFKTPTDPNHWSIGSAWSAPFDLADDYHVYGLEWDEKDLKFFFDGALVRQGPNTHWHQALTMNFDSETMPEWFGLPRDEDLPSTYSIEYVRSWQHR